MWDCSNVTWSLIFRAPSFPPSPSNHHGWPPAADWSHAGGSKIATPKYAVGRAITASGQTIYGVQLPAIQVGVRRQFPIKWRKSIILKAPFHTTAALVRAKGTTTAARVLPATQSVASCLQLEILRGSVHFSPWCILFYSTFEITSHKNRIWTYIPVGRNCCTPKKSYFSYQGSLYRGVLKNNE